MNISILAYHKVDFQSEWGINTVSPRLFEKQVKFLADNNFSSISLIDYIKKRIIYDKPVIFTFDDSYNSIYKYAFPILNKYGFKATMFVISEFVGKSNLWDVNLGRKKSRHLNWNEIVQLMNSGWEIGSHTATHPDLTRLTQNELLHELSFSKEKLEQKLSIPINVISYPFNRFNIDTIQAVRVAGYKGGCCLSANKSIPQKFYKFTIPRKGVYSIDKFFWFKLKLNNKYVSSVDDLKQKIICTCAKGTVYYKQLKKIKKNIAI